MSDSPLRTLLLAGRFELRGTSAYTLRLARNLARHDVTPTIVCGDARRLDAAHRAGLSLREFPPLMVPLVGRLLVEWLARDLRSAPPDLIHIQSRSVLSCGMPLARRLGRPYVVTIHDFLPPRQKLPFDPLWCRGVIAVSRAVQSDLLSRGNLPDHLVTAIPSGVDLPVDPKTEPVLADGHVPVIGTAGPLEFEKGLPFFLGAAARVMAARKEVEFLVAGAGPEEENLRRLARELRIDGKVTFVPNMFDFEQSLRAMDIFCLPSLRQGLGTIMLEAMALGKPVIATGVGGVYSAIRNNETGCVVPAADSVQLAHRMMELLDDPVRARSLGEAGRACVAHEFGVERMVAQTVEIYRRAALASASAQAG